MSKQDDLVTKLRADWIPVSTLMAALHWKSDTVRGAISNLSRKRGLRIERKRVSGVTYYRIIPELAEVA